MYANPVLLPEVSNREDFLLTVALFDDDTGEAIDLSGRTLAGPGDFTGNNWTVTSGDIVTASATQLTIPDYPIADELLAVALVVDENLALVAGAPVTIADPTGLNTMTGLVQSYVPSTGALVAQIGCSFDFEIRGSGHHHDSYSAVFDAGAYSNECINLTLGNGITIVDVGTIQVRSPASTMQKLRHRTYGTGLVLINGDDTRQIFVGKLPIIGGGVPRQPSSSSTSNPFGLP